MASAENKDAGKRFDSDYELDLAYEDPSGTDGETVFDKGLAAERTMLSWQRTVLALAVIGAVVARYSPLTPDRLFPIVFGVAAIVAAVVVLFWVRWRYARTHRVLVATGHLEGRDGKPLMVVVLLCCALSVGAVLFALFT